MPTPDSAGAAPDAVDAAHPRSADVLRELGRQVEMRRCPAAPRAYAGSTPVEAFERSA
ncbi:hypothetical protein [Streptomyces sp. KR80]|uniref:hypothetical protein n=1 Tax=Streptomyces sp. KR80 TaxID=3457426 RepID=UPI003FD3D36D